MVVFRRRLLMIVLGLVALSGAASGGLPPLADHHRQALSSVDDETSFPDDVFAVLADYVRAPPDRDGRGELVSLQLPLEDLLTSPGSFRGAAYRVEGFLQERRALPFPYQDLEEWFIRIVDRTPVIVYVPSGQASLAAGQPVMVDARFYKVLKARARDQQVRRYATFLGHDVQEAMTGRQSRLAQVDILLLLGFLILMVIVSLVVAVIARHHSGPRPAVPRSSPPVKQESAETRAAALEALHRTAEEGHS